MLTVLHFFFYRDGDHRDLHVLTHSCPTRRSSDLSFSTAAAGCASGLSARASVIARPSQKTVPSDRRLIRTSSSVPTIRSEEHTSELQSLMRISYSVFCLKKKTQKNRHLTT